MIEQKEVYSIIAILALVACDLAAIPVWRKLKLIPQTSSFAAGAAAAYVFLILLPEIETGHAFFGKRIHLVVLVGFILFYVVDDYLGKPPTRSGKGRFVFEVGQAGTYQFLIVFIIGENLPLNPILAGVYVLGLGLHLIQQCHGLAEVLPSTQTKPIITTLVSAMILGWAVHFVTELPKAALDFLTALLAGFVIYRVFQCEFTAKLRLRPWAFVLGALAVTIFHWTVAT